MTLTPLSGVEPAGAGSASSRRRVRVRAAVAAAWLGLAAPALAAQDLPARYLLNPALSRVWFDARASLGSFRGTASDVVGWAQLPDTSGFRDARGRVEIQGGSLRTGLALRDRHLREALQVAQYPRIVFTLERAEPPPGPGSLDIDPDDRRAVVLHGELSLHGTVRAVEIPARVSLAGDTLRVEGHLPILLTDYGIDPPSRLLGTARMRNDVELRFSATFLAIRS